jgi:hypothetical protein
MMPYPLIIVKFRVSFNIVNMTRITKFTFGFPIESKMVPKSNPNGLKMQASAMSLTTGIESAYLPPAIICTVKLGNKIRKRRQGIRTARIVPTDFSYRYFIA